MQITQALFPIHFNFSFSQRCCLLSSDVLFFIAILETKWKTQHVDNPQTEESNSLWPHGLSPTRLLCPWRFSRKNTWVGCCALLQGIFPTQRSNLGLPHCRQILYHLSHRGSPILETKWKIQHVDNAETKEPLNLRSEPYSTISYICLPHLMEMESKQLLPIPGWGLEDLMWTHERYPLRISSYLY